MAQKTIVFDSLGLVGKNNAIQNRAGASKDRHEWPYYYFAEEAKKAGMEVITADVYLKNPEQYPNALLLRDTAVNSRDKELIKLGVHPAVIASHEHPIYACKLFWNLKKETEIYDHTFMPGSCRTQVSPKTKFHPALYAQPYEMGHKAKGGFNDRKFLILINRNTNVNPLKKIYVAVMNTLRPLPTFINKDLYKDRLEAIDYFAGHPGFDLYGRGWNDPIPYFRGAKKARIEAAIKKSYRGEVDDKLDVLQQYKFSICYENTIFGGWITEKIIDSMAAGCIPVYYGAPDIEEYVPKNAFIDFRDFKNYDALYNYLISIDEKTYNGYVEAMNAFFASPQYYAFSQEKYAKDMIEVFGAY